MSKINLDDIQQKLSSGKTIEEIISNFDWKEFESLVADIFLTNGFSVKRNFRFKTSRRFEIDVIAVDKEVVFVVDCKEWGKGRYKTSGLRAATDNQDNRVENLKKFLKNNLIAKRRLKIERQEFVSVLVTWLQEELERHNNSLIIPVWKLNSFLLHTESFLST